MESSASLLVTPHHVDLPATSHSFLSPSSALLRPSSESSNRSRLHYSPTKEDKERDEKRNERKPFRSSLMETLRHRFPDGRPPQAYDEFIQVSLNDVPPDSALVMNQEHNANDEPTNLSPVQRLSRMTSRAFATIASSVASRPPLPLHAQRLTISRPRPMEAAAGFSRAQDPRTGLSPSPVQFYTHAFTGVGPPAPLPSPSDIIDIRPPSRTPSRNTTCSHSHTSFSHTHAEPNTELNEPASTPNMEPARPEPAQLATKNSIVFPSALREEKRKMVRIVTPRTNGASYDASIPPSTSFPSAQGRLAHFTLSNFLASLFTRLHSYALHILHFVDPAESLFLFGFITGPQTWLLGGWYLTSTTSDSNEKKSQLRVWIDKTVEQSGGTPERRNKERHMDELLERIEQASSSHLTSSSFEVGRRTVTDSNASRLLDAVPVAPVPPLPTNADVGTGNIRSSDIVSIMVLPSHYRSSRAVWSGSKTGMHEYDEDEISIELAPSRWVYRCRIAALVSGVVVMSLFISALAVVCLR